jgi:hypothetical protein
MQQKSAEGATCDGLFARMIFILFLATASPFRVHIYFRGSSVSVFASD